MGMKDKLIPETIKKIWRDYRQKKLLFKCVMGHEFFDNGFFKDLMDKNLYHSQCGQDFFLSKVIFPNKRDGVFIDIGANHPTIINNTYYFEMIGWTGLAFEPQKKLADLWGGGKGYALYKYNAGSRRKRC